MAENKKPTAKATHRKKGRPPADLLARLRPLAKHYYVTGLFDTYKAIGAEIGISPEYISGWAKEENWDKERKLYKEGPTAALQEAYDQLQKLNAEIKASETGYPNSKQQDTKLKLIREIKLLQGESGDLRTIVNHIMQFGRYCSARHKEIMPMLVPAQRGFLKYLSDAEG